MLSHGLLFEIEFGGQLYFYFNTLKVHLLHLITAKVSKNSKFMILLDFYLSNMLVGDLNFTKVIFWSGICSFTQVALLLLNTVQQWWHL